MIIAILERETKKTTTTTTTTPRTTSTAITLSVPTLK